MTSQHRYLPFGQVRTDVATPNSQNTDFGYTGQRNLDEDIGLMDYRARFYSPYLNRFIQPDTIVPNLYSPQMLNRFSYVNNRPINFNDPTGHFTCSSDRNSDDYCPNSNSSITINGSNSGSLGNNGGGSNGDCDLECELNNELNGLSEVVDPLYDIFGSNSDTGCNTYLLWNGDGWCHDNEFTQMVCYFCSAEQALGYNARFAYPGHLPWMPVDLSAVRTDRWVMGGDIFHDGFSGPTDWWRGKGAVYVETPGGNTIKNSTYSSHIFHEGNIVQTINEHWYGSTITVNGQGNNTDLWVAVTNQYGGAFAFEFTDDLMFAYATADQLSGGWLVTLTDMIP